MDNQELSDFSAFLTRNGAEILERTNPWELIRYKLPECGVLVGYKNSKGTITLPSEKEKHFERFKAGKHIEKHSRLGSDASRRTRNKILERDGDTCFYCGRFLNGDYSIEHLVNISDGGNNHIGNLVLTHTKCNQDIADLHLVEKLKVRDGIKEASIPPWEDVNVKDFLSEDAIKGKKKK